MPRLSNAQKLSRVCMHKAAHVLILPSYRELRQRGVPVSAERASRQIWKILGSKARSDQLIGTFEQKLVER
jgi:hypothetical protein